MARTTMNRMMTSNHKMTRPGSVCTVTPIFAIEAATTDIIAVVALLVAACLFAYAWWAMGQED